MMPIPAAMLPCGAAMPAADNTGAVSAFHLCRHSATSHRWHECACGHPWVNLATYGPIPEPPGGSL